MPPLHSSRVRLTSPPPSSFTVLPALKKAEQQQTASGKGKGKDAAPPPQQPDAGDGAASNAAAAGPASPAGHVLAGTLQDGRDPLDALRPEQHGVGYLYILSVLPLRPSLSPSVCSVLSLSRPSR